MSNTEQAEEQSNQPIADDLQGALGGPAPQLPTGMAGGGKEEDLPAVVDHDPGGNAIYAESVKVGDERLPEVEETTEVGFAESAEAQERKEEQAYHDSKNDALVDRLLGEIGTLKKAFEQQQNEFLLFKQTGMNLAMPTENAQQHYLRILEELVNRAFGPNEQPGDEIRIMIELDPTDTIGLVPILRQNGMTRQIPRGKVVLVDRKAVTDLLNAKDDSVQHIADQNGDVQLTHVLTLRYPFQVIQEEYSNTMLPEAA